jgi:hypothetical protein
MYFKTDFTSWKNPTTNEFISRKEYGKLGKRAAVNKLSTSEYLISKGYFQDRYNYFRLKDKIFLDNAEIIQDLKVVTVWLNNLRDDKDLEQAIIKIEDIIKILESK